MIRLQELTLRERRGAYLLRVQPVGMEPIHVAMDNNLGHIMSAWSAVLKEIRARQTGEPVLATEQRTGKIVLSRFQIVPLIVWPWRWEIQMESGDYWFRSPVDDCEHSVTSAFVAAMRFFGMKYGYSTIIGDETYQTEYARALGLVNGTEMTS